jgi:ElaB/YqjD/DUF883 family membrane-anchored ribosome-binding protein
MSSKVVTSTAEAKPKRGKGVAPQWDEAEMHRRTRLFVIALVSLVVVIWIGLFIWVFFIAPVLPTTGVSAPPPGASLLVVLAPIVAAATGVERLLESVFNTLENVWRTGVAYLGNGMRWLKLAETEVADARAWLQNIGLVASNLEAKYADEMNELMQQPNLDQIAAQLENLRRRADQETANVQKLLAEAEARATGAEKKLAQASSSPDYISAKAAASVVLGLMLGVIVATMGQIKMFALLGIAMPARIDVFATGIVIGSGSYPVHSLVGMLQQGRDALDGLGNFLNNRAAPSSVQATEQRITTVQPGSPGQPPVVGQAVIQTTSAQSSEPAVGG